jgi:hypothetical protein
MSRTVLNTWWISTALMCYSQRWFCGIGKVVPRGFRRLTVDTLDVAKAVLPCIPLRYAVSVGVNYRPVVHFDTLQLRVLLFSSIVFSEIGGSCLLLLLPPKLTVVVSSPSPATGSAFAFRQPESSSCCYLQFVVPTSRWSMHQIEPFETTVCCATALKGRPVLQLNK